MTWHGFNIFLWASWFFSTTPPHNFPEVLTLTSASDNALSRASRRFIKKCAFFSPHICPSFCHGLQVLVIGISHILFKYFHLSVWILSGLSFHLTVVEGSILKNLKFRGQRLSSSSCPSWIPVSGEIWVVQAFCDGFCSCFQECTCSFLPVMIASK